MSDNPQQAPLTPETAFVRLQAWYVTKGELTALKTREVLERKDLASFYFTNPREGVNRLDLGGGYDLKLDFSYNYKVDEAELDNVTAAQIKKLKLPWDDLFKYEPKLVKKVYNALTPEQKAFVDQLLTITDATPQLDIVPRADYEGSAAHAAQAQAVIAAEVAEPVVSIEDPDDAKPGDFYEDAEGQWWHVKDDGEWETVDNPNAPAPAPEKPKRGRGKKAAAS